MSDDECPGPHHLCKACRGDGTIMMPTLYVNRFGEAGSLPAPHTCLHCRGQGHFCKQSTPCADGDSENVIGPDALPPA
ncbi:hypothetical protein CTZ27_12310 [Streptomyces griseocarneus]|nr:hypothetical protein CTZ27_12310 [Streptomyces griseocarneus]